MKIRPYSGIGRQHPYRLAATVLMLAMVVMHPVSAEETGEKAQPLPIRITADKLVTDNQKRSARFSGNVKAAQGETVITCDLLTLFYKGQDGVSSSGPTSSIERMKADGNVRIEFDNKVAVSNQAVYIIKERKLVLTGEGSKVVSGQDEIVGSKITFFRDTGKVAMEGDVKAIIHSDQMSLN